MLLTDRPIQSMYLHFVHVHGIIICRLTSLFDSFRETNLWQMHRCKLKLPVGKNRKKKRKKNKKRKKKIIPESGHSKVDFSSMCINKAADTEKHAFFKLKH